MRYHNTTEYTILTISYTDESGKYHKDEQRAIPVATTNKWEARAYILKHCATTVLRPYISEIVKTYYWEE